MALTLKIKSMAEDIHVYFKYIIKGILSDKDFGITEVSDLKEVKSYFFHPGIQGEVEKRILENNLDGLFDGSIAQAKTSDYYTVMSFKNQHGDLFLVTVYDTEELWDDPVVIKVFQLNR